MNRKSHFPNHILLLYESALLVVFTAFLSICLYLIFLIFLAIHFQNPLIPVQSCWRLWRVVSDVKCCSLRCERGCDKM